MAERQGRKNGYEGHGEAGYESGLRRAGILETDGLEGVAGEEEQANDGARSD